MRTRLLVAAIAATASLAACGGEEPTSGADGREAANRKAMLDFARCMRSNGVDAPDPQFGARRLPLPRRPWRRSTRAGGRVTQRSGPKRVDEAKFRKAEQACAKYREAIKAPELSDEDKEKFRKGALEHARCMRDHGIDMPDPSFDEDGGAQVRIGPGTNIDPDSPKFREAQKACESKMPRPGDEDEQ